MSKVKTADIATSMADIQNFEQALSQLETLVKKMESENLPLQEALAHFEQGIQLTRQCQHTLEYAQQKVDILLKTADGISRQPFEPEV